MITRYPERVGVQYNSMYRALKDSMKTFWRLCLCFFLHRGRTLSIDHPIKALSSLKFAIVQVIKVNRSMPARLGDHAGNMLVQLCVAVTVYPATVMLFLILLVGMCYACSNFMHESLYCKTHSLVRTPVLSNSQCSQSSQLLFGRQATLRTRQPETAADLLVHQEWRWTRD